MNTNLGYSKTLYIYSQNSRLRRRFPRPIGGSAAFGPQMILTSVKNKQKFGATQMVLQLPQVHEVSIST